MSLKGKRIAVLAADLYQEMEIWYPLLRFREDGAETVAVGAEAGKTYSSKKGYPGGGRHIDCRCSCQGFRCGGDSRRLGA